MATSFLQIYNKFLNNEVDDYEFNLINDEELNFVLYGYLDKARSLYFTECKKDLTDTTESGDGLGYFNVDLTSQEQYILSLGMKKAWLSSKLYNSELMVKDVGDRDYKSVQGYNYVKQNRELDKYLKDELREYSVSYTWNNFSIKDW